MRTAQKRPITAIAPPADVSVPIAPDIGGTDTNAGATVFVWTAWVALTAVAFFYVVQFGRDVPFWDDHTVTPQLCGEQPVTVSWLWSQHSEHRFVLARLILLSIFRLSDADPRPVMLLLVAILAGLSALLIRAMARARGRLTYSDAFLPLAILTIGQHANLLWAIQITFVLPIALLGVVLAIVLRSRGTPNTLSLVAASICVTLMPLCNAGGLAFIPAMTAWFGTLAIRCWRAGNRRRAVAIASLALPALVLLLLYFRGYVSPGHHAAPGGVWASIRTTAQLLGISLGVPGASLWPWSGLAVLAIVLSAMVTLVVAWLRDPGQRVRIEGMIWVLAAVLSLAIGTGWGRSGEGPFAGLQPRYITLFIPALLVSYAAFACMGSRLVRSLLPMVLLIGATALIWPNTEDAWEAGRSTKAQSDAFDRDLKAGTPLFRLTRRYTPFLHPSQSKLHETLAQLSRAKIGKFRLLIGDPAFREQPIELKPSDVRLAKWEDGTIRSQSVDPWVRFDLPAPSLVCGVRIRYDHHNEDGSPAHFRFSWRKTGQVEFPDDQQYGDWSLPTGDDRTTTVWIDDRITQIRLQPDNRPCTFTIREMTLLLPPSSSPPQAERRSR